MLVKIFIFLIALPQKLVECDVNKVSYSGYRISIEEVPWTVRLELQYRFASSLCTGAIISRSWVLTAAHCVDNVRSPRDVSVYFGSSVIGDSEEQERRGQRIVVNPRYGEGKLSKYDIALVQVTRGFPFSKKVRPLELDREWPVTDGPRNPRRCFASGWGVREIGGERTKFLLGVNVTGLHGSKACECAVSFQNKRLVCLKELGAGICQGDSGSALVCDGKGVGVAHVIYLRSSCKIFTFRAANLLCNGPETVNAFMFICPELNWIHRYVSEVPAKPLSCEAERVTSVTIAYIVGLSLINTFL